MRLSFRQAQRIGVGVLLGIILVNSLVSVLALRSTVTNLRRYHGEFQAKHECFSELAFQQVAFKAEFFSQSASERFEVSPIMQNSLDQTQVNLARLHSLPLTADEQECVAFLGDQSQRLRTIVGVYEDSSQDTCTENLPELRAQISQLAQASVDRAVARSRDATESLHEVGAQLDRAAHRTLKVLTIGTISAVLVGIGVTVFLTRALGGHVARILTGTEQLAAGHLDYRINSPFKDVMGQLAARIDQMADRIQQANADRETVLANLPVGVVLIDEAGKIIHANRASVALLGAESESDLVGHECHGTICEIGCCSVLSPDESADSYEAEVLRRDGARVDVLKSVTSLELDGQKVLLESFIDITERKQAEEVRRQSESRFKTLFEHAGDAIMIHDHEGRLLDVNQEACTRLGYARRELLHMTLNDIESPDARSTLPNRLGAVEADGSAGYETSYLRRDGSRVPTEVISRVFDFAGRPAVLSIARDITERKQIERELQRAKESAEATSKAKGDFLARMSHEIRTPINGVIGMTELALDTDMDAEQTEYLETVKESADSLLTIINDILDFSKIEAGCIELESIPFSLRECVGSAVRSFGPRADAGELELLFSVGADTPDAVAGDPGRLRQILINLIGNSIKFTHEGMVSVRVETEEVTSNGVVLHLMVKDTGIGISPEKRKTIFESFEQADGSTTRKYGGTGLGLAISVDLAKLMGGRIWVNSLPGHGATFHVVVRLERQPIISEQASWLHREDLADINVLVVDSNPTSREFLLATLAQWKMRSMPASDGADALAKLRNAHRMGEPFELVLLDTSIGDPDGFAVADQISDDADLAVPVVMMFRSTRWQDAGDRVQTGVIAAHLTKPVDPSHLSEAFSSALGLATPADDVSDDSDHPMPEPTESLRVLLVEDNRVNQLLVHRLLSKRGHHVTIASNGVEGLDLWQSQPVDAVITDIQMPEMNGFAMTAAIRDAEADTGRHTPIVAMTAHAFKGDQERCLESGMDAYISKPINPEKMYRAIEQAITESHDPVTPAT